MAIPNPNDPTTSDAYVDHDGSVKVKAGIDGPQTAVGVVGFVQGMCMLWKGLAADKPKGWVIESVPAGSYLQIASGDGAVGVAGGTATAADHVHTPGVHTHAHSHTLSAHTHDLAAHTHTLSSHTHTMGSHTHTMGSHTHTMGNHVHALDHNHLAFDSDPGDHTKNIPEGAGTLRSDNDDIHHHVINIPPFSGTNSGVPVSNTSDGPSTNTSAGPSTNTSDGPSTNTSGTPSNNTSTAPNPDATNANSATPSANNTGGVVSTPIALTPLFYGLYLIRYTGAP